MGLLEAWRKLTRLSERVQETSEAMEELQREFKTIAFEWDEMHEKFSTLHARLSKRVKKIEEHEQQERSGDATLDQGAQSGNYAARLAQARSRYGGIR